LPPSRNQQTVRGPSVIRDAARVRRAFLLVDTGTYDQISAQVEELAVPAKRASAFGP